MRFFSNGCCRFDDWSSTGQGYKTIVECLDICRQNNACIAADVARPEGKNADGISLYDCYTFNGDGKKI